MTAGVELIVSRDVLDGLAELTIAKAARRAGHAASSGYRYWSTQADFRADVVSDLISTREGPAIADTVAVIRELVDGGASFDEIILAGCSANVHRRPDADDFFGLFALRSVASTHRRLRADGRERFERGLDDYILLYDAMLRLSGRRPRPPLSVRDIALTFAALGEGFVVQAALGVDHPAHESPPDTTAPDAPWPLLARVVRALVDALTEPRPPRPHA